MIGKILTMMLAGLVSGAAMAEGAWQHRVAELRDGGSLSVDYTLSSGGPSFQETEAAWINATLDPAQCASLPDNGTLAATLITDSGFKTQTIDLVRSEPNSCRFTAAIQNPLVASEWQGNRGGGVIVYASYHLFVGSPETGWLRSTNGSIDFNFNLSTN